MDEHCEDFAEVAKRYNHVIERHAGVDLPGAGIDPGLRDGDSRTALIFPPGATFVTRPKESRSVSF